MHCPRCKRQDAVKNGKARERQRYKCKSCGFQFTRLTSRGRPPLGPTPDSAADGAVLLDDAEISRYLKTQSESDKSGKIFVVIPEDVSSEDVVVGIKRD